MGRGQAANVRRSWLPREVAADGRTTPSVRDKTSYASTATETSAAVPIPSGAVAGDVHYIFCQLTASAGAITTPTGYTAVVPQFDSENSTSAESACFRKDTTLSGGGGSVTISFSSGRFAAASLAVRDVDTSVFEDVAGASDNGPVGTATAIDAPTLTPANANSLLLTGHTGRRATVGEAVTYLPPSGMAEEVDVSTAVAAVSNASVEVASLAVLDTNPTGTKTATADLAVSASGMSVLVRGALAGGQTIAAGQVTETETAQAVGRLKVAAAAQVAETEAAQALTRVKTLAAGQAVETEAAQAVGKAKVKAAAQATETETAQAIAARKTIGIGQAVETETAQAVETGGGTPVAQATETEVAQAVAARKAKAVAQATETETAQAVAVRKTIIIGQAVETEAAQAVGRAKVKAAGQAVETETAQAVSRRKTAAVAQVTETETAQAIQPTGPKIIAVGQAVEAELAQAVGRVKARALAQAAETEAAQALARLKVAAVSQATEIETAQSVAVTGGAPPPRWVEHTAALVGLVEGTALATGPGDLYGDTYGDVYGSGQGGLVEGTLVGVGIIEGSGGV